MPVCARMFSSVLGFSSDDSDTGSHYTELRQQRRHTDLAHLSEFWIASARLLMTSAVSLEGYS